MGKISKALDKFARERKEDAQSPSIPRLALNQSDYNALVNHDRKTGHLVGCDPATGAVDSCSIDLLREQGTIQRLLDNELIYPTGKLTRRGLEEANRLERLRIALPVKKDNFLSGEAIKQSSEPAGNNDSKGPLPSHPQIYGEDELIATYEAPAKEMPREDRASEATVSASTPVRLPVQVAPAVEPLSTAKISSPLHAREASPAKLAVPKPALAVSKAQPSNISRYDERRIDSNLVALLKPQSYEAEQFKILRTNILYPVAGESPRSILVTSTAPGEGKTFAAANLAISIALNINKHVLLIDADLRRPQMHERFGFQNVSGLSNYLADGRPLPSLLLKTMVDKLSLLPGGPPPENPSELISSERMATLMAEVASRYADRLIVIDAPPPAIAAETGVLARQVDSVLIVVRYGSTQIKDLSDLIADVGEKKILGSIVNYMETSASRYYGYKYGGYKRKKKDDA